MSEAFFALVPIRAGDEPSLREMLEGFDPGRAGASPFSAVPGTHVVRLTVVDSFGTRSDGRRRLHPALLSISVLVDGPVEDWLRSMAAGLGPSGDALWAHCLGWPGPGPAVTGRWLWSLRQRMHLTVIGHPDPTVDDVRRALDQQRALRDLAIRARTLTPKELRVAYGEQFGATATVRV
ncbi:MAG TPA: hypothetical protein VGP90_05250 [Acidimicrobiia bacterium]|nr:hypothetical protein [Acidimicrobiia bacterium]